MENMKKMSVAFTILLLCLPALSFAAQKETYKIVEVKNGGSIEGTVVFAGTTIPKDEIVTLTSEQHLCGKTLPAQKYLINSDKRIKNVVVFIESIDEGKSFPKEELIVDNLKCAFVPHVSVGYRAKDVEITISNSDPVFHNVHSYVEGKTVLNLGLPDQGSKVQKSLRKTGVMEVKCDSHPWMLGYVYVLSHPYGVVTNDNGEFSINDIPPGTYNIKAWHEALGEVTMENVKIEDGKPSTIKLEFK